MISYCLNCGTTKEVHGAPPTFVCPGQSKKDVPTLHFEAQREAIREIGEKEREINMIRNDHETDSLRKDVLPRFDTGATRNLAENLSWAAGFFDGEGSTSCTKNNGKVDARLQVSVGQKDYRGEVSPALLRFFGAMGCGHIYHKAHYSRDMNQHQFQACSYGDVVECLRKMWPYLSQPKKDQARVAITRYGKARGGETTINGLE